MLRQQRFGLIAPPSLMAFAPRTRPAINQVEDHRHHPRDVAPGDGVPAPAWEPRAPPWKLDGTQVWGAAEFSCLACR
ncbi:hypothetical protein GEV33_006916 [Tenebrio molitor]|uniref:Uncharacterized protein n=1 Tax=Tenebrio molitor TaxID=7067 RepID=A0A8J6HBQ5_TENMO|nr:hypothetical protein GEV33_006916 [Tenebrio molitor]